MTRKKVAELSPTEVRDGADIAADDAIAALRRQRPRKRGDCLGGERPCPWYSCKYHLGCDVTSQGYLLLRRLSAETCALDVADRGEHSMNCIGQLIGTSAQAIDDLLKRARQPLRKWAESCGWDRAAVSRLKGIPGSFLAQAQDQAPARFDIPYRIAKRPLEFLPNRPSRHRNGDARNRKTKIRLLAEKLAARRMAARKGP